MVGIEVARYVRGPRLAVHFVVLEPLGAVVRVEGAVLVDAAGFFFLLLR